MVTDSSACSAPGGRNCVIVNMGVRQLTYPCNSCNLPRAGGGSGSKSGGGKSGGKSGGKRSGKR